MIGGVCFIHVTVHAFEGFVILDSDCCISARSSGSDGNDLAEGE